MTVEERLVVTIVSHGRSERCQGICNHLREAPKLHPDAERKVIGFANTLASRAHLLGMTHLHLRTSRWSPAVRTMRIIGTVADRSGLRPVNLWWERQLEPVPLRHRQAKLRESDPWQRWIEDPNTAKLFTLLYGYAKEEHGADVHLVLVTHDLLTAYLHAMVRGEDTGGVSSGDGLELTRTTDGDLCCAGEYLDGQFWGFDTPRAPSLLARYREKMMWDL